MNKRSPSGASKDAVAQITETALSEFMKNGKVTTARCDVCGSLIDVNWLGTKRLAVSIKCTCGKFHGAIRGLLN